MMYNSIFFTIGFVWPPFLYQNLFSLAILDTSLIIYGFIPASSDVTITSTLYCYLTIKNSVSLFGMYNINETFTI